MKKRLLILLFVMVLALSVFSVTASAAPTISSVVVENLRFPLAGNTPDYNINFTNGNLAAKTDVDGYDLINGVIWYRLETPNTGSTPIEKKMSKNDVFELGQKYRVRIFVMPQNDAQFASSAVTSRIYEHGLDTVGSQVRNTVITTPTGNTTTGYKVISCDYLCDKAAISSVEITGLKLPKSGEYPDNDCNVITEGVYVNNLNGKVEWMYNGSIMDPATDKFVAGQTYKLSLFLKTEFEYGYHFLTDALGDNIAEVFINGILFEVCDTYEYDYIRNVEYEFYVPFDTISNVDIVGISHPIAGKEPDFEGAPTTDGYDIVDLFWLDETLKTSLIAGGTPYVDAANQAKLVKGDGKTFEAGHEYSVCIEAQPQEGYEIDYDPGDQDVLYYNATVNGKDAEESSGLKGDNASFSCSFGTPIKQLIFNVDITGVDSPVAGNTPDYTAVCGKDSYSILNMFWVDITQRDALKAGGLTHVEAVNKAKLQKGDGKTFTAGHKYSVTFEVKPGKNYEIDYDPADFDILYYVATVNGEDAQEGSGNRGDNASFTYDFEHTCVFDNACDTTCNECSAKRSITHTYSNACDKDCNVCKSTRTPSAHKGGTATCKDKAKCSVCGVSYGSVNKNNHKSLTTLKAVAATCTKTGLTEGKKCADCGVTTVAQKTVAKKTHTLTTLKAVAATCTKEGKTEGKKCTVCGTVTVAQKAVAKKAHSYKSTTTKATLTKNGKVVNKCTVCGNVKSTTTVYYPKTIKLSATSYTYNKKVKEPTVTVKDSKGNTLKKDTDYTVSYEKGRKLPGKYTVKITFKGKYDGVKRLYFTIKPRVTSSITASQTTTTITLKWTAVTGADSYRVYKYNSKTKKYEKLKDVTKNTLKISKLKAGTAYKYKVRAFTKDDGTIWGSYSDVFETATKCKTPSIKKLTTTKGKASFTWSNVAGESGYQVYYSSKKDSGYKKVASYKTNVVKGSKTKLKSGKKYYFKVRAYKKTASGTVYSSWSAVKSIKIK